jgi:hypothetical protein
MKTETYTFPRYNVNGKDFGTSYELANMYWQVNGGTLMEKLDQMTPSHVLQQKELTEAK